MPLQTGRQRVHAPESCVRLRRQGLDGRGVAEDRLRDWVPPAITVPAASRKRAPGGSGCCKGGDEGVPGAACSGASAIPHASQRRGGQIAEAQQRMANRDFEPEGQGELQLQDGDHVEITHDPERDHASMHRWLYGVNQRSKEHGWFPLSYTGPVMTSPGTKTELHSPNPLAS